MKGSAYGDSVDGSQLQHMSEFTYLGFVTEESGTYGMKC